MVLVSVRGGATQSEEVANEGFSTTVRAREWLWIHLTAARQSNQLELQSLQGPLCRNPHLFFLRLPLRLPLRLLFFRSVFFFVLF